MTEQQLQAVRAELRELKASFWFAYAHGHQCSNGDHPEFQKVRQRVADLCAILTEHTA